MSFFILLAGVLLIINSSHMGEAMQEESTDHSTNDGEKQSSEQPALMPGTQRTIRVLIKNEDSIYHEEASLSGYPGEIEMFETEEGYVFVNEVSLEDYIAGVLYSEMPSSFSDEALKAQAVCARSFALSHMNGYAYPDYQANVDDSVSFQAYYKSRTDERARLLVEETANYVLTRNGTIINAYFFSTSCGVTADGSVWRGNVNYLQSVRVSLVSDVLPDLSNEDAFRMFYQQTDGYLERDVPWFRWMTEIGKEDIRESIGEYLGYEIGTVQSIHILERENYGLVQSVEVITDKERIVLEGQNEIRTAFATPTFVVVCQDGSRHASMTMLPSAYFYIEEEEETICLYGCGFGHGGGMSQYGAQMLAREGKDWQEILGYFFPSAEITSLMK